MSEDLLVLLVMGGGALVAPLVSLQRNLSLRGAFRQLNTSWQAWAQSRGHTFVPGNDSIVSPQSPRVRGTLSPQLQAVWTLDTMVLSRTAMPVPAAAPSASREAYTVVAARALSPLQAAVVVRNRRLHGHLAPPQGYRAMDLSDSLFDDLCQVLTEDERVAQILLDPRTRKALVALAARPFVFTCVEGAVWIRWPGRETDANILDAGVEALLGACSPRTGLPQRW